MIKALFTSDLHGNEFKYEFLFENIVKHVPEAVFIGGDILIPFSKIKDQISGKSDSFLNDYLRVELLKLKERLRNKYPEIYVIMGNDDNKFSEEILDSKMFEGLLHYCHFKKLKFKNWEVVGYNFVPPTPFMNKDWEKFDVSRFVDVGCLAPFDGYHDPSIPEYDLKFSTIKEDFETLFDEVDTSKLILLAHTPPYKSKLDRADLDGVMVDHVPLDVYIGSIALQRLLEKQKFYLTLHGHVHESTRLTGDYQDTIGENLSMNGASEHNEASIILFDLENPTESTRLTKLKP